MDLWDHVELGTPTPYRSPGAQLAPKSPQHLQGSRDIAVTVILPAYNEAVALAAVLDALFSVLGDNSEVVVCPLLYTSRGKMSELVTDNATAPCGAEWD